MNALHAGEIDAIFDEGIRTWFDDALAVGMAPIELEEEVIGQLGPSVGDASSSRRARFRT